MFKRMAVVLIMLSALTLCLSVVQAEAKRTEYEVFVSDSWGERNETGGQAIVSPGEILISAEIIKWYTDEKLTVHVAEKRAEVVIQSPRFKLETERLDSLIQQGVTLNFPLRLIEGKPYLNMVKLDQILGLAVIPHPHERTVEIRLPYGQKVLPQINKTRVKASLAQPFNVVWDHVTGEQRNLAAEKQLPGLHVISPTWFAVVNEAELVLNNADRKYVDDAHSKNYQVWALVSNSFNKDVTKKILADELSQANIIKQLVTYVSMYNLDGLNVDFENMYDDDKDRLTAFLTKLGAALKEQNVVFSIDVTVPSKTSFWSLCYDRQALGRIADYIMVMTYDEHWRLSPVSGSTASLPWVEKGVKAMLAEVPKEKLLLGIPFYTREWEETITEEGKVAVKSQALSMEQADKRVADHQASVTWLDDKGQYYTEYEKNGKRYRIWLENKDSIALKALLVPKYGLAGTASWRKGFEKEEIWQVLHDTVKK